MTFLYKTFNKNKQSQSQGAYARIPDIDVPFIDLDDQYFVEKCIAEGFFAKIFLARHRDIKTQVILKACHNEVISLKEFTREFHYSYQLSHHPNIVNTYNVAFQTNDFYFFAMEHAPYSDLAVFIGAYGISESCCKKICEQLSSALGFMHSKKLVHRDIKLENILVFALDFSRIKLADFGGTTREGLLVRKTNNTWTAFLSPEVLEVIKNERFHCRSSQDVWSFGVIIYLILTGSTPWDRADWVRDTKYALFMKYQKRETQKVPDNFRRFTPRLLRCFRRFFDHDERDRAKATDILKYMKDKWLDPKCSSSKFAALSAFQPVSDKDSVVINLSTTNRQTKTLPLEMMGAGTHNAARTKRIMSSVGLIRGDNDEKEIDSTQLVTDWLKHCHPEPYPVEESPDTEWPEMNYDEIQRPFTYEQWFLVMNNNNNNNSDTVNNNNLSPGGNPMIINSNYTIKRNNSGCSTLQAQYTIQRRASMRMN